jgi:hypothetical protein
LARRLPTESPSSAKAVSSCSQAAVKNPNVASSNGNATAGTGVAATTERIRAPASIATFCAALPPIEWPTT